MYTSKMKIKVFPETKSDNGSILDVSFVRSKSQTSLCLNLGQGKNARRRSQAQRDNHMGAMRWGINSQGALRLLAGPKNRRLAVAPSNTKTPEVIQISQNIPNPLLHHHIPMKLPQQSFGLWDGRYVAKCAGSWGLNCTVSAVTHVWILSMDINITWSKYWWLTVDILIYSNGCLANLPFLMVLTHPPMAQVELL